MSDTLKALDDLGELLDQLASNAREFDYNTANRMERDAAKALLAIEAAVNALPELLAEIEVLRRLAPEYFRWTGDIHQTEDPEWACDKLKYGGAHFENIGTPEVRLVVYDDQDRRWVAERGDYIVKGEMGLWVLPARAALNQEPTHE